MEAFLAREGVPEIIIEDVVRRVIAWRVTKGGRVLVDRRRRNRVERNMEEVRTRVEIRNLGEVRNHVERNEEEVMDNRRHMCGWNCCRINPMVNHQGVLFCFQSLFHLIDSPFGSSIVHL